MLSRAYLPGLFFSPLFSNCATCACCQGLVSFLFCKSFLSLSLSLSPSQGVHNFFRCSVIFARHPAVLYEAGGEGKDRTKRQSVAFFCSYSSSGVFGRWSTVCLFQQYECPLLAGRKMKQNPWPSDKKRHLFRKLFSYDFNGVE